jgi:hypothetical protein
MAHPVRHRGVTLRYLDGGSAEVAAADGTVLGVVNATGAAAFELCDGATTVDEMAAAASDVFDVEPERASAELAQALADLAAIGAVDHAPGT